MKRTLVLWLLLSVGCLAVEDGLRNAGDLTVSATATGQYSLRFAVTNNRTVPLSFSLPAGIAMRAPGGEGVLLALPISVVLAPGARQEMVVPVYPLGPSLTQGEYEPYRFTDMTLMNLVAAGIKLGGTDYVAATRWAIWRHLSGHQLSPEQQRLAADQAATTYPNLTAAEAESRLWRDVDLVLEQARQAPDLKTLMMPEEK